MDDLAVKNQVPELKYFNDLTPDELENFRRSAIYGDVHFDYRYTQAQVDYYQAYYDKPRNYTFVVKYGSEFLLYAAIYPINDENLAYFKFPVKVFINRNFATDPALYDALSLFKKRIEQICSEGNFKTADIYEDPLVTNLFYDKIAANRVEISAIVDLKLGPELIKKVIRKRFKSYINWGEKNLETTIYDHSNITAEVYYSFQAFHERVAGRKTRPQSTWDVHYEMIRNKEAYLIVAKYKGELASANLYLTGISEVEYGVGVNDRSLSEEAGLSVSHYPMYQAMIYAWKNGFKKFNLNDINNPSGDDKYKNISYYKKGFATELRSLIINQINFIS